MSAFSEKEEQGGMADEMKQVVITAPHSFCQESNIHSHSCDTADESVVSCLVDTIQGIGLIPVPFLASTPRRECDLNRKKCRKNSYRVNLTSYMKKHREEIRMVLDVHSFPPDDEDWGGYDVILLDDAETATSYTLMLQNMFLQNWVRCKIVRGGGNDIQDEARERGMKSLLIECSESVLDDDSRRLLICKIVANWVNLSE